MDSEIEALPPLRFPLREALLISPWFSEWAALCANCFGGFCFIGYAWPIQSKQHGEEPSIEEDWPPQAPWGTYWPWLCWRAAFAYSTATAGKRKTEDCSQIGAFRSEPEERWHSWDQRRMQLRWSAGHRCRSLSLLPKCLACHVSLRRPMICRQAFGQPGLLRHERFWGTGGGRQHDNTPHLKDPKDPKEKQNKWMLRRQACCKTLHGAVHLCRVFQGFQNLWRIGRLWPALAWSSQDAGFSLGDRENPEVKNLIKRSPGFNYQVKCGERGPLELGCLPTDQAAAITALLCCISSIWGTAWPTEEIWTTAWSWLLRCAWIYGWASAKGR